MRNLVNNELECAHNTYCSKLFDNVIVDNFGSIFALYRGKDSSGISTLLVNDQFVSDPKGRPATLRKKKVGVQCLCLWAGGFSVIYIR